MPFNFSANFQSFETARQQHGVERDWLETFSLKLKKNVIVGHLFEINFNTPRNDARIKMIKF